MYDLLVLTLNEENSRSYSFSEIYIKALNDFGKERNKYYYEIWPFINNSYGILYKIFTTEGLGAYQCCDEMFDFIDGIGDIYDLQQLFPNISASSFDDCLSMKLTKEYYRSFIMALDSLISHSPISTIAFLCRGQSADEEVILGSISFKDFTAMLQEGRVRTNICYIVRKTDDG